MGLVGVGCHCYSRPHLTTLSQVYIFENQKRIFPNHFSSHAHAIKINQNWAALDGFDMVWQYLTYFTSVCLCVWRYDREIAINLSRGMRLWALRIQAVPEHQTQDKMLTLRKTAGKSALPTLAHYKISNPGSVVLSYLSKIFTISHYKIIYQVPQLWASTSLETWECMWVTCMSTSE